MSSLLPHHHGSEFASPFSRIDRLFEEWMRSFPIHRPFGPGWDVPGEELIRVDQYRDDDTEVIRAELPGIDPAKDVDITLNEGMLQISAERRMEEKAEDKGFVRHELRYGSLRRTLPVPEGVSASDITATYKNGILEIRVPIPRQPESKPTKIEINKG